MKTTILFFLLSVLSFGAMAQTTKTDQEVKVAMSKLSFLNANWEGKGWMYVQGGKKEFFDQTEKIQFKLDGTVLLIEGLGSAGGEVIHNALAIVSYNKELKEYNFKSYLSSGREGTFKAEIKESAFYWYPNSNMRYIISLNEKGQWFETGEMNREGKWVQFFEMTLNKVK